MLHRDDAQVCPWIQAFEVASRVKKPYSVELKKARPIYEKHRPDLAFPLQVQQITMADVGLPESDQERLWWFGTGGLCDRGRLMLHCFGNCTDMWEIVPSDAIVGIFHVNESIPRLSREPMAVDVFPTITMRQEPWVHAPMACRSSIMSPQEAWAVSSMSWPDMLQRSGLSLQQASQQFSWFEMISLAGRAFEVHAAATAFLAAAFVHGPEQL